MRNCSTGQGEFSTNHAAAVILAIFHERTDPLVHRFSFNCVFLKLSVRGRLLSAFAMATAVDRLNSSSPWSSELDKHSTTDYTSHIPPKILRHSLVPHQLATLPHGPPFIPNRTHQSSTWLATERDAPKRRGTDRGPSTSLGAVAFETNQSQNTPN